MFILTCKKKRTINLNDFACNVAALEGKKKSIDIAQVKEIIYCAFRLLAVEFIHNPLGVIEVLRKHAR